MQEIPYYIISCLLFAGDRGTNDIFKVNHCPVALLSAKQPPAAFSDPLCVLVTFFCSSSPEVLGLKLGISLVPMPLLDLSLYLWSCQNPKSNI